MAEPQFSVKIEGLDRLQKLFARSPEIVGPVVQTAMEKSKVVLDSNRVNPSNIPWITGELARRWSTSFGKMTLKTKPDVEYARAVQFGMPASPGRFVPAIGKRLVNGPNIGMWPGFTGRHFMEKIIDASRSDINLIFKNALGAITSRLAKD